MGKMCYCFIFLCLALLVGSASAATPVANFSGTPTAGPAPVQVAFTDLSLPSPTGWAWYFGDENFTEDWTQQTLTAEWSARYGHSSVAMPDGSIVLMGGVNSGYTNDVWRSTDDGATWTQVNESAGWSARYGHSSVAMPDGSIVLMGGWDGYILKNDVWRSTDNGTTWTQVNASAGWSARYEHSSVAMPDGSIVLMGGWDDGGYKNDVWRSTDNGATWTQVNESAGWTVRYGHSSVAMPDGSIVLTGGSGLTNDVWRSTDNGATWTQVKASAGWSARYEQSSVAMPDGSIVLMGGSDSGGWKNDVWRLMPVGSSLQNPSHTYTMPGIYSVTLQAYNDDGYNVTRKKGYITVTALPVPVAEFTASFPNNVAPLPVSFTDLSLNNPEGWAWYFGDETFTESWTQTTASAGWPARFWFSSVVMPDGSIVLMGGYGGGNDVWRSSDNGATWTQVTPSAEWTARSGHTSVVMPDGSIVLLGGRDDGGLKNDVWRSIDKGATWTQVTPSAEWTARYRHSSVALPDGSIVVMGGVGLTNDVWRSTDNGATWTQVNASAGWSARWEHTSVAMPDGSIVLMGGFDGGVDGGGYKNDVWRSTDNAATWNMVSAKAEWTARSGHTSVTMPDGSIVLMGGLSNAGEDSIYFNDVYRSTNNGATWTQVKTNAGWTKRAYHNSVVLSDSSILLMGGTSTNDVWRLMPAGSLAQNPTHIYTAPGIYPVALQVYNSGGYNKTLKIGYVTVPAANCTANVTVGSVPLAVQFTDTSTGSPISWNWSFGDGHFSDLKNPVHTYESTGVFTVSLKITYTDSSDVKTRTNYISVREPSPGVIGIAPTTGGNTTSTMNISLTGAHFTNDATVMLTPENPNPVNKSRIRIGGHYVWVRDMYVSGTNAYFVQAGMWNYLNIYDVSDPANPVFKGEMGNGNHDGYLQYPTSVFVSGTNAYITNYLNNALEIVDVSDPSNPVHKGNISDGVGGALLANPRSVYVSGNYAYVVSWASNALEIVDISDPANPVHKASISDVRGAFLVHPMEVFVAGNYAYVLCPESNALEIVDVSDPANPEYRGSVSDGVGGALLSSPSDVYVSGIYAYVASGGSNALEIVDVSDPANPVHKGSLTDGYGGALLGNPVSVYVFGNDAYITSPGSHALEIVDVSDPANPVHKGSITGETFGVSPNRFSPNLYVSVSGTNVYFFGEIDDYGGFGIVDSGGIPATNISVVSSNHITGTINLTGKAAGRYNVMVTNPDGQFGVLTRGFTITADSVDPVAAFTSDVTSGYAPLSVQFNDTSTGNPTMWNWSFGDEQWFNTTDVAVRNATHVYQNAGTYTVNLTVTKGAGSDTESKTDFITVISAVLPIPGYTNPPTDPDSDGLFEDLNANGFADWDDAVVLFWNTDWIQDNEPLAAFDFNHNGFIDWDDAVVLFWEV